MENLMETTPERRWMENPLVRTAIANCSTEAEAVDVLEELHRLMLDLEAKAPGVPFAKIFGALDKPTPEGLVAAGMILLANGHAEEEVDEILGSQDWRRAGRAAERERHVLALHAEGNSVAQICILAHTKNSTVYRIFEKHGLSKDKTGGKAGRIGRYAAVHGVDAACDRFVGTSRKWIKQNMTIWGGTEGPVG